MALNPDFNWDLIKETDWDAIAGLSDTPEGFLKVVRERFPAFAWAIENPELKEILTRAVDEEWTSDTFDANFRATEWFTTRSEMERQYDILAETDPGETDKRVLEARNVISQQASQLVGDGRLDDATIDELARRSVRSGMAPEELAGVILDRSVPGVAGEYAAAQTAIKGLGRDFLTDVSSDEATRWTRDVLTGRMTTDGIQELLRERSRSRFPALGDLIDQGVSLADYFSDHRSTIGQMMGLGAAEVDLVNDSRWAPVLGFNDDANGIRPMTASETQQYVRSTDGYYRTQNGRAEAASMKRNITSAMGLA